VSKKILTILYSSEWKIVTYLNLQQAINNVDLINKYVETTIEFCKRHDTSLWLNLTECRTTINDATRKLGNQKEMRSLVRMEKNTPRAKRGLFNFVEQISHSLFGVLESEN
jgi:superfamily I DNA and/or RNA helicase